MELEKIENIQIEKLYLELLEQRAKVIPHKDYEVLECKRIKIQTYGDKYVGLKLLSRHKTSKHLIKVTVKSETGENSVTVTTDHICMIYNKDHFFENTNAKNLRLHQYVSVFDEKNQRELVGEIINIEDQGTTEEYVYDCEVDDDMHAFYANNILVHNSQFMDLQCVTETIGKRLGIDKCFRDWPKKAKREVWDEVSKFVDDEVNPFVRQLIHDYCHTNQQNVLTYELEYMTDCGVWESKKHYFIHKCFDEGDAVDKIKVTGIELKKNSVPKEMKVFLEDIYKGVVMKDWKQEEYDKYIGDLYQRFTKFKIEELSFWKGYSTARESEGFLQMKTGATGMSKSVTYYNQIIEKLGLGKKYEQIRLGEKVRQCYLKSNNKFGIDTIAFKDGQWPKEFNDIFQIDYYKMFTKLILDPLKRFREACKFDNTDPSKQTICDIFDL